MLLVEMDNRNILQSHHCLADLYQKKQIYLFRGECFHFRPSDHLLIFYYYYTLSCEITLFKQ